jgi:hypothetical protein
MFSGIKFYVAIGALVALVVALFAGVMWLEGIGYDRAEKKYKPLLVTANANVATWKTAAEAVQADNALVRAELTRQSGAVDALHELAAAALARKDQELAALRARSAATLAEVGRLSAIANGPPAATQAEACTDAETILRDLAVGRLRD